LNPLHIRRLRPDDSLDDLTALLHRAFGPLGRQGLPCDCVDQSPHATAARARRGACFVAVRGARLAGTMTLEPPGPRAACAWYRRPEVATLHQFAVDPCEQGLGAGTLLLRFAERWVAGQDYSELALETPACAARLVAFYAAHGFRTVGRFRKDGKPYDSLVLSKRVADPSPDPWTMPRRQPWHGALVAAR